MVSSTMTTELFSGGLMSMAAQSTQIHPAVLYTLHRIQRSSLYLHH